MVTMLPSVWQSVTVLALVVIVSTNVSQVSSYCSNRSGVCISDKHLDRKEREAVLKGKLARGNELDRTFRDSLRRDINALDHIQQNQINRFDRLESQSRLRKNIRLSHQDQRRTESDEQNNREFVNRFDKRQLKPRDHRYQQILTVSRRLEHNQNRYNLRRIEVRNDVERKSSNVLKEEFTRLDRIREDRVRNVDDREQRLDRRVYNRQARDKQVYELRMRENRVHEERAREIGLREVRVKQARVRTERVRKEPVRVERVRVERVREARTREMRFLDEIKEPTREARNEHFGEERSRDSNVRDERIRNERIVDNILNREEINRRQLPDHSYNTRNSEMKGILNVDTRSELISDRKDNRQVRVEDSQRSLNDRRKNRRIEMKSENRNEKRHQGRLEDVAERQIRSVEDRRQLENRLSINQNIQNRDSFRRVDERRDSSSRRDISSRIDIVNDSEEKENRYSDRLSAFYNDYRRDTSLKEFTQLTPQLSWNFCQAVLIGAIVLQIIKYKDGISKSKSLNAFMNYLPLMSHNHIKAL